MARLYQLKSRHSKPGTLIAASVKQLSKLGLDINSLLAAKRYWPGPISVIIETSENLTYLDQGLGSLAARVPDLKPLISMLRITGPLITSSANLPGKPPASTIDEAKNYFGDLVDFYVDGGDISDNLPSTLIKLSHNEPQIIRQGAGKL